ncbi:MAG: TonB-dependent receptor [Candidatus Marinimicrobia bacterium]|nr:TonB-dependent receptor [Candidatus Neomarinimicrobiota bacterium]
MHRIFTLIFILFITSTHAQDGIISGFVYDETSRESLIGANVYLKGTSIGTATDENGYFVLSDIPHGEYELLISYLGFDSKLELIQMQELGKVILDIELIPTLIELSSIDVTAEKLERKMNIQISRTNLNVRQLKTVPQVGEADLFRTLQALPGVLTESEFSTGLIIRGGNSDQNLILLDGITVYNPSHVGGFFSSFILDAIKEADLMKGGFNADYGGRLSAVLNVRSRDGNQKSFTGKSSLSLLSFQSTLEGPIGKGAWLAAGRRTYFDQVFKGTKLEFPYYFWDLQGHIFQDITSQDRVSISWYAGTDDLYWDEFQLEGKWGNETISLNYRKLFSQRLVANTLVAKSRFDILFGLGGESGINEKDYIDDMTFRSDWTWFMSQKTHIKFGLEYKDLAFVYSANGFGRELYKSVTKTQELATYLKMKYWVSPSLMLEPGYRLEYYGNSKESIFHDPRLAVKYLLTDSRYLNFSIGQYHQFMETIQDDFNPKILDAWFAVDESIEPASAKQYVVGYEEYFDNNIHLQIEGYYKSLKNILTFVDSRSTEDDEMSSENLDSLVDVGDGYAYGGEFFLQKEAGRVNGWVSYAWSLSRKTLNGKEYYTNWDRRHVFNIIGNIQLNQKWSGNFKWTYQSGQPFTPILGYYEEHLPGGSMADVYYRTIPGVRNSGRYPDYHRLDVGLTRKINSKYFKGEFFIQVVNTYWQKNVFRYFYEFGNSFNGLDDDGDWDKELHDENGNGVPDWGEPNVDEADEGSPQLKRVNGLPIIPTIGISVEF